MYVISYRAKISFLHSIVASSTFSHSSFLLLLSAIIKPVVPFYSFGRNGWDWTSKNFVEHEKHCYNQYNYILYIIYVTYVPMNVQT